MLFNLIAMQLKVINVINHFEKLFLFSSLLKDLISKKKELYLFIYLFLLRTAPCKDYFKFYKIDFIQELLELLGMPVLRASGEAEALCAQLNREGHVDACITSDSDAFLFGAKCVIKSLHPSSKVCECYVYYFPCVSML